MRGDKAATMHWSSPRDGKQLSKASRTLAVEVFKCHQSEYFFVVFVIPYFFGMMTD